MASTFHALNDREDSLSWIPLRCATICSARRKMKADRRRTAQACDRCKQKKTKCNGHSPCGTCTQANYQCHYTVRKKRSDKTKRDSCGSASEQLQPPFDICDQAQYSPEASLEHVPALVHSTPSKGILQSQMFGAGNTAHVTGLMHGSTISHASKVAARSIALPYKSSIEMATAEGARFHHHVLPRLATSRRSSVESQDQAAIEDSPSKFANSATPTTAATLSDQFGSPRPWSPEGYQTKRRESYTPVLHSNSHGGNHNGFHSPTAESKASIGVIRRASHAEHGLGLLNGPMQDGNSPSILPCATAEPASVQPACNSGVHYGWHKPLELDEDGALGFVPTAGKTGPRLSHNISQSTHDQDLRCCDHIYHQSQWYRSNLGFLQFQNQCSWGASNGMPDYEMASYPPGYSFGGADGQQLLPWQSEMLLYDAWQWH